MIIYKITNNTNGKVYIGQTIQSLAKRFYDHYTHTTDTYIKRAILCYGIENFSKEVIDTADNIDSLNEKEEYWIKYYNSCNREKGYNRMSGGGNSIPNEDTRKLMSKAHTGKKHSAEGIEKQRQKMIGRKFSKERCENISKSLSGKKRQKQNPSSIKQRSDKLRGQKRSPEQIERMRMSQTGKKHSEETKKKMSESRIKYLKNVDN